MPPHDPTARARISVVKLTAADLLPGDVFALPDEVYVPVAARVDGRRTWVWQPHPAARLANPHQWRLVYQTDRLDADIDGHNNTVPAGFRLLRISNDDPRQGDQHQSTIIAVRDLDLLDVQDPPPAARPTRDPAPGAVKAGHSLPRRDESHRIRDAALRVFDRTDHSDDASDMYVLGVFGITLLTRLRRTDPEQAPQLYVHIENETGEHHEMAVEVNNTGAHTYG